MKPHVDDAELEHYLARRERVLGRIRQLLIATLDLDWAPEAIDPDTALFGTGLGLDSLDAVEVVIGLEMELGIVLEGEEARLASLRSVNALVDRVLQRQEQAP